MLFLNESLCNDLTVYSFYFVQLTNYTCWILFLNVILLINYFYIILIRFFVVCHSIPVFERNSSKDSFDAFFVKRNFRGEGSHKLWNYNIQYNVSYFKFLVFFFLLNNLQIVFYHFIFLCFS